MGLNIFISNFASLSQRTSLKMLQMIALLPPASASLVIKRVAASAAAFATATAATAT